MILRLTPCPSDFIARGNDKAATAIQMQMAEAVFDDMVKALAISDRPPLDSDGELGALWAEDEKVAEGGWKWERRRGGLG